MFWVFLSKDDDVQNTDEKEGEFYLLETAYGDIHINQKCYVKWNQVRSYSFDVTNGTRQGGVFSPRGGFNTYLDVLIQDLIRDQRI